MWKGSEAIEDKSKLQLYTKNPEHIFGMPGIGRKVVSEDADLDVKQLDRNREDREERWDYATSHKYEEA